MFGIIPSFALLRRILPAALVMAALLAACVFGYAASPHLLWFAPIPVGAVVFAIWLVMLMRAHPDEWRFWGGPKWLR